MSDVNHKNFEQIESLGWASRLPKRTILAGAMALAMSSSALAETCTPNLTGNISNSDEIASAVSSVAGNIVSAITTAQTAFLLQSTAFVSNPGNPAPDQQGSGVWTRAVVGQSKLKSPSVQNVSQVTPGGGPDVQVSGTVTCDTRIDTKFVGVQFGHDIARLNHNGWNIHFGTTAGYLESHGETIGGPDVGGTFNNRVQSPFAGTYLVLSKGGFFADALLRFEHYEATFNGATLGILNQALNARGVTVAASAGYHYAIPNSRWFFEPSVGVVASRTTIDTFNLAGFPGAGGNVPGVLTFGDVKSVIGRAGFRVGTTLEGGQWIAQPFFAASVWHDFEKAPTATYNSINTIVVGGSAGAGLATTISSNYVGSNVGTYGQFSAGMSAQLAGTGWVAFGRVDYRIGNRLEGWDGTGGVRYHFTPEPRVALVGKSPVYKAPAPVVTAHNWTGLYMGASAGAAFARDRMDVGGVADPSVHGAGGTFGGQIGYNWQFSPQWVGGLEGTIDLTNLNGARECIPQQPTGFPPLYQTTCHFDSNWLATFTGRLGYVWGRALWYVKAGGAYMRETVSITCNLAFVGGLNCRDATGIALLINPVEGSVDRLGFTAGYGVEFALTPKWTARAETSYLGFGSKSLILSDGTLVNSKMDIVSTRIGVNYKLTDR